MNIHRMLTLTAFMLATAMTVSGQTVAEQSKKPATSQRIGDYIESLSNNSDKRGAQRTMQYEPTADGAFRCVNGENRFTRALYGAHTGYRLETSDRPVFAIFVDSKTCRHIRLKATIGGITIDMDKSDWCEAIFKDGMRTYRMRHNAWHDTELCVKALCLTDRDGCLLEFAATNSKDVRIDAEMTGVIGKKLSRNGDIGADKAGVFESDNEILQTTSSSRYILIQGTEFASISDAEAEKLLQNTEKELREMCSRVSFKTPDAYINTLGSALIHAADGAWDGQTWLHGAIGWRTELAGWRAGYLADVLGWHDRARSHFDAYAKSQVTDKPATIPHPTQDASLAMARSDKKWGTQMYSDGYICRKPGRSDIMNHYDMNLNYFDELLWHFQYDADTTYMRKMWPALKLHLEWEKRNFDPDNDHLYDGYCCIWASDALYYSGGAATHASAYNYRGNHLAARIAEIIGEDAEPYRKEAEAILKAMDSRLFVDDHWAECQDLMGLKRVHPEAAIWSEYTPIDCGACSLEQAKSAVDWVTTHIPHINVDDTLQTISTSAWTPYSWSINNVASAEVMNMVLAYFKAGRSREGFKLLKANIMDQMYLGISPGNFGQISFLDAARGECYRDFSDNTGISARAIMQGLFGIVPDALNGRCYIQPGFPEEWDSVEVNTPYLSYKYKKQEGRSFDECFEVEQRFPQHLQIIFREPTDWGKNATANHDLIPAKTDAMALGLGEPTQGKVKRTEVKLDNMFNAEVDDIYRQQYLSPRPPYTTLQIPVQGIGEWCHPLYCPEINDSVYRSLLKDNHIEMAGIKFRSPATGKNIIYNTLWDNYPSETVINIKPQSAKYAYLLMAGSTNHMQSHIDNAEIIATYTDGTTSRMPLVNPQNWCPIEQDYYIDGKAFSLKHGPYGLSSDEQRPYRIALGTTDGEGKALVSRNIGDSLNITEVYGREISGGAAQMLMMPLDGTKRLKSMTLRVLSNDVVIGIMGITLEK